MAEVAERSTVEILKAARERITPREHWTVEVYARDADNAIVEPGPDACMWCAVGSLMQECGDGVVVDGVVNDLWNRLDAAAGSLGLERNMLGLNDSLGHAVALRVYDAAVQLAEQEATNAS